MSNLRDLLEDGGLIAAAGTVGIVCADKGARAEQTGQNNTVAGGGSDLLPDLLNPGNPGAPLIPRVRWDRPPWNRWTYQRFSEMVPTASIWRGPGPVRPLPEALQPLGGLVVNFADGARTIDDHLRRNFTDGFLVLHRGRLVFERYMNNFAPHKQHTLKSATKSFTGTLAGILANKGLLDVRKPVTDYLPELNATAYRGATVQHLLDMASGVYAEEELDTLGCNQGMNVASYQVEVPGWPRTFWELVLSVDKAVRPHGASHEYRTIETTVVGFVLQRVSGMSMADLISQEIWAPMGAEQDAYITVDRAGTAAAGGGLCVTMRDCARFGQLFVEGGARDGRQIIPRNWIEETLNGDGAPLPAGGLCEEAYHNFWRIDRGSMAHGGYGGQYLYVEPQAQFVAVKMSYFPDGSGPYSENDRTAILAIRDALSKR
ncbi:serine hydrolase [Mesorhizobium sp.]|uniref:serine hydrolase domain-containing protein n=1 Tax=Mesorhizobium sp. TaxID=1871066 RepID=UPI00257D773F|nr:serine hydrolase [Mesorhizobium sp.]